VAAVKIIGEQRIALVGIAKKNLPTAWKNLNDAGFVSGHAYGKALRSIKTCVGDLFYSFGIRSSVQLRHRTGEDGLWWGWAPHKVKLGVSGCSRNCSEATIKDLGLVAVESGWEIYIRGQRWRQGTCG